MSWFNPYGLSFELIWGRLRESYPHEDEYELFTRAIREEQERRENIMMRVQEEIQYVNNLSPNNKEIIDEPDEDFRFFFCHPQESSKPIIRSKLRLPFTKLQRESIITRLGKHCSTCNKIEDLQIHHIDENPSNNELDNLKLLCYRCHKKVHAINLKKEIEFDKGG